MRSILFVIAMCYNHVVQANPSGYFHNHKLQLEGVPNLIHFSNINYPNVNVQDFGDEIKGPIPENEIKVTRIIKISVPKPYPVKVPVKVPYPVHVDKPYPVPVTKLVHVPQPVPVEVIKSIPVPVEVPKPYPVPSNEYNTQVSDEGKNYEQQSWHPSSSGQQPNDNYYQNDHYSSNAGFNSQYDQNGGYSALAHIQRQYERQDNVENISNENIQENHPNQ